MKKIAITFDQGRVHVEIDLDISKESLNDLIKAIAQGLPNVLQGFQSLIKEKAPDEDIPKTDNTDTPKKVVDLEKGPVENFMAGHA